MHAWMSTVRLECSSNNMTVQRVQAGRFAQYTCTTVLVFLVHVAEY